MLGANQNGVRVGGLAAVPGGRLGSAAGMSPSRPDPGVSPWRARPYLARRRNFSLSVLPLGASASHLQMRQLLQSTPTRKVWYRRPVDRLEPKWREAECNKPLA